MMKKEKGIALVSLIITIAVMTVIASTVVYISLDRFQINEFNKMVNDIGLLEDKVSNYYLRYGGLPVLRDKSSNQPFQLDETKLTFTRNPIDNSVYYILDLEALDGISLNYGKDGFEAWKNYVENSLGDIPYNLEDVYIINENTHTIYYVKGINLKEKNYYYIKPGGALTDNIPPSRPQINIISGETNDEGVYITAVEIEIIPGEDRWSGIGGTIYTVKSKSSREEFNHREDTKVLLTISEDGLVNIEAKNYDNASTPNYSEITTITLETHITHIWDSGEAIKAATCTEEGKIKHVCTYNGCSATKTETVSPLEHSYTKQDTASQYLKTPATCTRKAVYYYSCENCGAKGISTFEYGSVLGHNFDEGTVTTAATCTTAGVKTYTCTSCGATKKENISTIQHSYTKQDTSSQYLKTGATCTSKAVYYYSCVDCGAKGTNTFEYGSVSGHDYTKQDTSSQYLKAAATCTTNDEYYYICTKCGGIGTNTFEVGGTALGHGGIYMNEATHQAVETYHYIKKTCSWCGTSWEGYEFCYGHSLEYINGSVLSPYCVCGRPVLRLAYGGGHYYSDPLSAYLNCWINTSSNNLPRPWFDEDWDEGKYVGE